MFIAVLCNLLRFFRSRSLALLRLHEFDRLHAAQSTHIPNHRPATLPFTGPALEVVAELIRTRQQVLALK